MSLDADLKVDRQRLKRRLGMWRIAAVAAVAAALLLAIDRGTPIFTKDHIARYSVSGIITEDIGRAETLDAAAKDPGIKGVIVRIDSPGGTVVGGEALYKSLRTLAESKPVAVVMGELATSAGYMAALGADRIFAREGSITGSIGVIFQATDVTGLLAKLGISTEALKSAPLKAVPSPLEPLTPEGREATMAVIDDVYQMFVRLVVERRRMGREEALKLADGRVFTGGQAIEAGLVDEIGSESEAIDWMAATFGIDAELPIEDLETPEETSLWRELIIGFSGKTLIPERLTLDGLVSLWHPDLR